MQAISRDQTEKEIFVVVGNSGRHAPAPTLACWAIHAEAPRVEPFSRTKGKPSSAQVRSCRYVVLAHRTCSGSPGTRGHRRWGRFGRSASLSNHTCGFTSSECCGLCGYWIDSLVFWGSIFLFLSKATAKLVLPSVNPSQLPISQITGKFLWPIQLFRFARLPGLEVGWVYPTRSSNSEELSRRPRLCPNSHR
jgi:hypothetical protein